MGACVSCSAERSKALEAAKSRTRCTNLLDVSVDVWINGGGPFARKVPPGGSVDVSMKHVDPRTTRGPKWEATYSGTMKIGAGTSTYNFAVARGNLLLDNRSGAWIPVVVDAASSRSVTGELTYTDLVLLINAQHRWRGTLKRRREEHAKIRRRGAIAIQAAMRGRLTRKLTTCFVCMDEVAFAAKVSTVPEAKCHRACFSCVRQYVDTAISDGRLFIRCPGEGCIHLMDVSGYCSPAALTIYRANVRSSHVQRLDGETDAAFVAFCREHARACPACGVIIWRYAGCDHIHCRCGHHFQWGDVRARVKSTVKSTAEVVRVPVASRDGEETAIIDVATRRDDDNSDGAAAYLRMPGNDACIDCAAPRPTWASLSLGCALCIRCAGLHRALGVETSFVRSLTLDQLSREEAATLLRSGGNAALIAFANARLVPEAAWAAMDPDARRSWYRGSAADTYRSRLAALRAEIRADLAAEGQALAEARTHAPPPPPPPPPMSAGGGPAGPDDREMEALQRLVAMGFYDVHAVREALLRHRGDVGATALALVAAAPHTGVPTLTGNPVL